ncbi:Eaa1 [Klebsiella pneumoniae]|nr:Eaa1 [Klebsiella pneumoniae]
MTKSTITRDELNEVIATYGKHHIAHRMANLLLAAMDSEPDCKERKLFCSTDTARMRKVISVSAGTGDAPLYRHAQPAPEKYNIGDATMRHIFTPTGMTNVSDMQAVFDRVEAVLVGMDQPAPVVPDGYVMVPMRLTAENGAKGALSGEFSETKFVNCPECFGDDECETCDGSGRIEITVPVTWTTIKDIWAKGVEHFAAAPQEVGDA